ncbi:MAG TPA: tetratricopeptide repeat protein, partial [Vulgatibacter sp.]
MERRRREASARLAAGDPEEAIAHCEPVIARLTACRLLVASAALDLRRWALAESAVRPARGSLGPLEPWGALLLGEALAGAGKAAEAVPLLDEARRADPTGPLGDRAEPAEALALLRSGRAVQARSILSRLVSKRRDDRDELRLALAEATLAAGDRAGAASLLRTIWIEAAGRPASEVARERLDALAADGAGIPAPTSAERLDRATRLLDRGESRRAEHEIADVPSSVEPIRRTWLLARALSDQDRKDEAETLLAPLLAALPTGDPNAHDLLELAARLAMRRGDAKEAIARLDRIQAGSSGQRAASADFLAAFFLYDDGRFEEAERRFRSHLAEHPGHRADESLWYVGWSSFKAGDFAGARKSFAALEAKHPNSSLAPQAHYWQAKAAERAGDAQGAVALYRKTAARWPGEWYGALARQRLEMPLRPAGL